MGQLDLRTQLFHEPSDKSRMTVLTPSIGISVEPSSDFVVSGGYTADIVSGASEAVKAGPLLSDQPDIVSQASVEDLRHIANGGFSIERDHSRFGASYTYGIEKDYRSHAFSVTAGRDFFKRNTELEVGYARGFDDVCNLAQPGVDKTLRSRLDSSDGCFTSDERVTTDDITIDNFQAAWTQTWTPVLVTQLVLSASLQNGFLGNPYREVVLGPSGQSAQENHPDNRARTSATLRTKYYLKPLETAVTLSVRGYRDSWEILSQTYMIEAERFMAPWMRLKLRGRFYSQTEALFWSDDYTGGEPRYGARGQYWSGDREMSPLKTLLGGGRFLFEWHGERGNRVAGMFLRFSLGLGADVMKTLLDDFTWAGRAPNDSFVFIGSLSATGHF